MTYLFAQTTTTVTWAGRYEESLSCFDCILCSPPSPLAHADVWFQIGHVYKQQKRCMPFPRFNTPGLSHLLQDLCVKDAYEHVVADNPIHAKVIQQLGWLYHQDGSSFQNQELAIQYLIKSLEEGVLPSSPLKKSYSLCCCRPFRCPELISPWACIHGRSKVQ